MSMKSLRIGLGVLMLATSIPAAQADVAGLQQEWAKVMYALGPDEREPALAMLADRARQEVAVNPEDADLLIWRGIIVSTYAGEKGGLGALRLAKEARASLEAALAIDDSALQGSAYTSLGSLYYKVPGWPLGFGDDKKARAFLTRALEINPSGIDSNFFMGEFLFEEGAYAEARAYLVKAAQAPDRQGRALADDGRRSEIRALMEKVERKLQST